MKIVLILIIFFSIIFLWICLDFYVGNKRKQRMTYRNKHDCIRESNIKFFTSGKDLFSDLFIDIKKAEKHIHILFYIVKNDEISRYFLKLLIDKATAGIEVRLLLDWFGSRQVPRKLIKELQLAGGQFSFCHVPKAPYFFYSLQVRNHRKITVIDGKIGYLGGYNVGQEYIDGDPRLSPWRDYHLKIAGEGVLDLQTEFLVDWYRATNKRLYHETRYFPTLPKGNQKLLLVPSQGVSLEGAYLQLIRQASESIFIGSPYFIPSKQIISELLNVLKNGVTVTILVPFYSDHFLVKEASLPYLRLLIQNGANVYAYLNGFYHAKIILIDQSVCDIGTANFDRRSLFINDELNGYIYDDDFIKEVNSVIEKDLKDAKRLTLDDLYSKNLFQSMKEIGAKAVARFL